MLSRLAQRRVLICRSRECRHPGKTPKVTPRAVIRGDMDMVIGAVISQVAPRPRRRHASPMPPATVTVEVLGGDVVSIVQCIVLDADVFPYPSADFTTRSSPE